MVKTKKEDKLRNQNSYRFFENKECQFFPCHKLEKINCLFCYCPLYSLNDCGGNYITLKGNIKDCTNCKFPHVPENYDLIMERLTKINDQKKQQLHFNPISNDIE